MLSLGECRKIISKIGFRLGISPCLIESRLLSDDDKRSMLEGTFEISSLQDSVEVWRDNGMPDYAHGKIEPYEKEKYRLLFEKQINKNRAAESNTLQKPFARD